MRLHELTERSNLDQQARKYLRPMLNKYKEIVDAQSQVGRNVQDPKELQLIIGSVINRYANLLDADVPRIKQAIISSNLTNDNDLTNIFNMAIKSTLAKRLSGNIPTQQQTTTTPPGQSRAPAGTQTRANAPRSKRLVPGKSQVNYMNKTYTWANNAWRSGTEVLTGNDAQIATRQFRNTP